MAKQLVEGRLFTSSYDGCLNVWDVSQLGSGNDANFRLRYPPRVAPLQDKQESSFDNPGHSDKSLLNSMFQNKGSQPETDKILIE